MSTVQLVAASTLFGAATVAAAFDAGVLTRRERTILVVQSNTPVPEARGGLDETAELSALRDRFDEVVRWNDVVAPYHPKEWRPRPADVPLWERVLRDRWQLGDARVELVAESLSTPPSAALAAVFASAPVVVYADGLMVYGPTRFPLPYEVGGRVEALLHLDLVPGLRPTLLGEWGVEPRLVPAEQFRKVVQQLADAGPPASPYEDGYALLLGQYLAAIGLLTPGEELELEREMVRAAVARGCTRIVMKPHPSAPPGATSGLAELARSLGADFELAPAAALAETLMVRSRPGLVVSCFSTALATAASVFDVPTATVGTRSVLERLEPFENSNRVPAVIADALGRGDGRWSHVEQLQDLVRAVAYCQQPRTLDAWRPGAEEVLGALDGSELGLWFGRARLTALGLPGGHPVSLLRSTPVWKLAAALDRRSGGRLRRLVAARGLLPGVTAATEERGRGDG